MASPFRRRGFNEHEKEAKRREKQQKAKSGNVFRFFIKADSNEEDIPIRFLTEEPILFYEHTIKTPDGKFDNITCTGEGCDECAKGDNPAYRGAWLIVDGRPVEINDYDDKGNKVGKKTIRDTVKIYSRGEKDIAKLKRKSQKYGLTDRPYFVTRLGSGNQTTYELERGDKEELSMKQLRKLASNLPKKYSEYLDSLADEDLEEGFYEVVEDNIFGDVLDPDEDDSPSGEPVDDDDDGDEDLDDGVQGIDEEAEEMEEEITTPKKKPSKLKPKGKTSKKPKKIFKR